MGFEYGSQTIEIRNPFRLEGAAYLVRGLATAPLGVYLILNVPGELSFGAGVLLVGAASYAVSFGLFKLFRFYVGRGAPTNLARIRGSASTLAPGADGTFSYLGIYDPPSVLSEMLLARKNVTFEEPRGWLSRLMHGLSFRLIFLPHPMRWGALKSFMAAWYLLVGLVALGFTLLYARATGLFDPSASPVASYLGAAALVVGASSSGAGTSRVRCGATQTCSGRARGAARSRFTSVRSASSGALPAGQVCPSC